MLEWHKQIYPSLFADIVKCWAKQCHVTEQVRHHSKVPTTAVAQGSAWPYGAGKKKGSGAWSGAARASTLDGRQWLDAHLELANPVETV